MIRFCQSIQHASPINAHFSPEPAYMPGYEDDVIMAAGTFVQDLLLSYQQMVQYVHHMKHIYKVA